MNDKKRPIMRAETLAADPVIAKVLDELAAARDDLAQAKRALDRREVAVRLTQEKLGFVIFERYEIIDSRLNDVRDASGGFQNMGIPPIE